MFYKEKNGFFDFLNEGLNSFYVLDSTGKARTIFQQFQHHFPNIWTLNFFLEQIICSNGIML